MCVNSKVDLIVQQLFVRQQYSWSDCTTVVCALTAKWIWLYNSLCVNNSKANLIVQQLETDLTAQNVWASTIGRSDCTTVLCVNSKTDLIIQHLWMSTITRSHYLECQQQADLAVQQLCACLNSKVDLIVAQLCVSRVSGSGCTPVVCVCVDNMRIWLEHRCVCVCQQYEELIV